MSARKAAWSYQNTSLGESFLWSLAVTALPVAAGFVVSWVIARWAGPVVIGTVSWVMSFATMLEIPAKFGMDLSGSQLASELGMKSPGRLRALFRTAIGLRLVFTAVVSAAALVFAAAIARFFKDPALTLPIRVGAGILFCVSLYEFQENFLIGLNRLRTVYKIRSLHLSLRIAVTVVVVMMGAGAIGILAGYCAAWIVAIAIFGIMLHRFLPAADSSSGAGGHTGRLMRLSLALTVSSASVILYSHMDRLILGYFSGVSEVGQYAVARNIAEVSLFPVFAAMMMLRPALAARFSVGKVAESARIITETLRYTFASGVWFCALFAALGVPLVTLVFGDTFRYAGQLLVWFVGVIAFRSVGAVILPALVAAGRARLYAYLTMSSAAIYFLASIFLIPGLQSRGAILATFGSYGVLMVIGLTEVFRIYGIQLAPRTWSAPLRTILAGAVASGVTWWITERSPVNVHVLAGAALVTIIYLFLIFLFRVGTISDLRRLRVNLRESNK